MPRTALQQRVAWCSFADHFNSVSLFLRFYSSIHQFHTDTEAAGSRFVGQFHLCCWVWCPRALLTFRALSAIHWNRLLSHPTTTTATEYDFTFSLPFLIEGRVWRGAKSPQWNFGKLKVANIILICVWKFHVEPSLNLHMTEPCNSTQRYPLCEPRPYLHAAQRPQSQWQKNLWISD